MISLIPTGLTEDQYRDRLFTTVVAIKEHSGGAKLIWATTTPMRESSNLQRFSERTERVKVRNKLAGKIVKEYDVSTNDLFELVQDHADWESTDGVHFNGQGNVALAMQVAESVAVGLPAKESSGGKE